MAKIKSEILLFSAFGVFVLNPILAWFIFLVFGNSVLALSLVSLATLYVYLCFFELDKRDR